MIFSTAVLLETKEGCGSKEKHQMRAKLFRTKTTHSSYRSVNPFKILPLTVCTPVLPSVPQLEPSMDLTFRGSLQTSRAIRI